MSNKHKKIQFNSALAPMINQLIRRSELVVINMKHRLVFLNGLIDFSVIKQ